MPRNVEIKAKVENLEELKKLAAELSKSSGDLLEQQDTFFQSTHGRLKLRIIKVNFISSYMLFRTHSLKVNICDLIFIVHMSMGLSTFQD